MGTTLKEIAGKAGVSTATVSMALNNKKGVSPEKAKEIRKIAEELRYQKIPDFDVSGHVIHFIQILKPTQSWDDHYKIFIAEYLEGLTTAAAKLGLIVEVKTFETESIESVRKILDGYDILGIIFLGAGLYKEDVEILRKTDTLSLFIDVCYPGLDVDFIDMDNAESVYKIIEYLKQKGHNRIGLVQALKKTPNFEARQKAFEDAMKDFGLGSGQEFFYEISINQKQGWDQMKANLSSAETLPAALFCVNDKIAYNCIHACQDLGISIPDDMAIIGFDDLPASQIIRPNLTTFSIPKKIISTKALQLLLERSRIPLDKHSEKILIGGHLIIREST